MRYARSITISLALVAAFFVGRASHPGPVAAESLTRVYVARAGDVVRIPSVAARCVVTGEAGIPNFLCERAPTGRYEVVLDSQYVRVWRNGNPDAPAFAARWKR